MLQNFWKAWKNNRGNLLISLGIAAGLLMCLVWYLQLVPEIRLVSRSISGTLVSKAQRPDQNPLVVLLRMPPLPASSTDVPQVDLRVIVEIHLPNDTLELDVAPLFTRAVTLRNDGNPQVFVFNEVQAGKYAVLAYIDLNDNEKFDLDELSQPLEPYRLSRRPVNNVPAGTQLSPQVLDLEKAGVEITPGQATLVEFNFQLASN